MTTTMQKSIILVSSLLISLLAGCQGLHSGGDKTYIWNGRDFSGWKLYIPPDKAADVEDVWSVRDGVIYCTGKPNGYMRTEKEYSNYHLHLEWRWPEEPTNSGVLLHVQGKDQIWPMCIENQLKTGNAGDFVLIHGTGIMIDGKFYESSAEKKFIGVKKKAPSSENPPGEWNHYDIYCKGDTVRSVVNGVEQNYGTNATVSSGSICLQSEGGPIEFRNIYIETLD